MSDTQAAMREFRFLDEKRKTNGLTPTEQYRWQELGASLGVDLAQPDQAPQGYYGPDGQWYQYPPGFDPNAWAAQTGAWQGYYPPQGYYDPNTGAWYYYDPNTGAYYPAQDYGYQTAWPQQQPEGYSESPAWPEPQQEQHPQEPGYAPQWPQGQWAEPSQGYYEDQVVPEPGWQGQAPREAMGSTEPVAAPPSEPSLGLEFPTVGGARPSGLRTTPRFGTESPEPLPLAPSPPSSERELLRGIPELLTEPAEAVSEPERSPVAGRGFFSDFAAPPTEPTQPMEQVPTGSAPATALETAAPTEPSFPEEGRAEPFSSPGSAPMMHMDEVVELPTSPTDEVMEIQDEEVVEIPPASASAPPPPAPAPAPPPAPKPLDSVEELRNALSMDEEELAPPPAAPVAVPVPQAPARTPAPPAPTPTPTPPRPAEIEPGPPLADLDASPTGPMEPIPLLALPTEPALPAPKPSPAFAALIEPTPQKAPPPSPEVSVLSSPQWVAAPTSPQAEPIRPLLLEPPANPEPPRGVPTSRRSAFEGLALPPDGTPIPTFNEPLGAVQVPSLEPSSFGAWNGELDVSEPSPPPTTEPAPAPSDWHEFPVVEAHPTEAPLDGRPDEKVELAQPTDFIPWVHEVPPAETHDFQVGADLTDFVLESGPPAVLATGVSSVATSSFDAGPVPLASNAEFIPNLQLPEAAAPQPPPEPPPEEEEPLVEGELILDDEEGEPLDESDLEVDLDFGGPPFAPPPSPPPSAPLPLAPTPVPFESPPPAKGPTPDARPPLISPPGPLSAAAAAAKLGVSPVPLNPPEPPPARSPPRAESTPVLIEGEHRVILHTMEGGVKRGAIRDANLASSQLVLQTNPGVNETIPRDRVKAIFFMLSPGSKAPAPEGLKVRVTFRDGRQVAGYSIDHRSGATGFFVVPADHRTNTERIFIYRHSVTSVSVEG